MKLETPSVRGRQCLHCISSAPLQEYKYKYCISSKYKYKCLHCISSALDLKCQIKIKVCNTMHVAYNTMQSLLQPEAKAQFHH